MPVNAFAGATCRALQSAALAAAIGFFAFQPGQAIAADSSADATYAEIEKMMGGVPTFVRKFPKSAVAGAWAEQRDLEFNDKTALPAKVKALISLAVAAQIPCEYCIWADTRDAMAAGATEEEIAEAVAMAALTRHWSTFLHGMQIDFDQFKAELGGH